MASADEVFDLLANLWFDQLLFIIVGSSSVFLA